MRDGCVFCDYEGPSAVIRTFGSVFVIAPIDPVVPGHLLVIPRHHVEDHRDEPYVAGQVFECAAIIAREIKIDTNLISSAGPAATQTIKHLHVHVVPRRPLDGLALPWSRGQTGGEAR